MSWGWYWQNWTLCTAVYRMVMTLQRAWKSLTRTEGKPKRFFAICQNIILPFLSQLSFWKKNFYFIYMNCRSYYSLNNIFNFGHKSIFTLWSQLFQNIFFKNCHFCVCDKTVIIVIKQQKKLLRFVACSIPIMVLD